MTGILEKVGQAFRLAGKFESYEIIKDGNINSTFNVTYCENDARLKSYVFQKINTNVFKYSKVR